MPLMMSALSYSGIVPYETFRDRWKWAVVGIFGFGALFSPPDPFTQIMWAAPLVGLYVISLGISKMLVQAKRAGEEVNARAVARTRWNKLAAAALVVGALVTYVIASPVTFGYVQRFAAWFPSNRLTGDIQQPAWFGLPPETTALLIGAAFGLIAAVLVLYYYMIQERAWPPPRPVTSATRPPSTSGRSPRTRSGRPPRGLRGDGGVRGRSSWPTRP